MSLFDEERPVRKTVHDIGQDLSLLSVDELKIRIELLKSEISRLEAEAVAKGASRAAADSLFKR
ncbi:DUF1192 domain-containing protein [Rhizobium sp. C4]|uniref:DUF1192 domain-containing protein n=1 Tax=Rhizobium sp. C4 TaxID=1349800 RepID=UPI001E2D6BD6|nr:DUF1192 domain-containing protein [Rhizobium sp. C4]MCD2174143.1 DUF1192 domain-containing protein [Rhizobium sp. C4]